MATKIVKPGGQAPSELETEISQVRKIECFSNFGKSYYWQNDLFCLIDPGPEP